MTAIGLFVLALPFLALPGALSQSVKSCGGPNDHLKNPVIKLMPDPIKKGGTLTIEASGTLDEDISVFNSNVDLNIQALRIIHASVKGGMPLSISPAAAKGPFSLTVGPFALPRNVPGSAVVNGQVHVVDGNNEPVMCIELDLNVPGMDNEEANITSSQLEAPRLTAITSCGKATDHMHDFKLATSGGVVAMTGTLDETVTRPSVALDVKLKVLFVSVPLKLNIPIATSPGLPKGAIKITAGPNTVVVSPNVKATMKGTMKLNDGNGEEITCLNIDTVVAGDKHIVV